MRRVAGLLLVLAASGAMLASARAAMLVVAAAPAAPRRAAPALRIVGARPLVVAGRGFRPRERLRLTATVAGTSRTEHVTAARTGAFHVTFGTLGASRCDLVRVVARRQGGRPVVVKRLPPAACSLG